MLQLLATHGCQAHFLAAKMFFSGVCINLSWNLWALDKYLHNK
jgi:hypothetical protein